MSNTPHDATMKSPRIYTKCPACGNDTLTIGEDKHLLCTWIDCKAPTLIDRAIPAPGVNARLVEASKAVVESVTRAMAVRPRQIDPGSRLGTLTQELNEALALAASSPLASPTLIDECEALLSAYRCRGGTGAANVIASHMASLELALEEAKSAPNLTKELAESLRHGIAHHRSYNMGRDCHCSACETLARFDATQKGQQ